MRIIIDGAATEVPGGTTLLHALQGAGIDIPSLCDDPRLQPYGACRMCLVRVDGERQPVASCVTDTVAGMVVETAPDDIEADRAAFLGMMAHGYPADARTDTPFHALLNRYRQSAGVEIGAPALRDDTHPCIDIDMNQCIDCFRCVRICDELQGQLAWQIAGRGPGTHVVPSGADTLLESACVSCGACVDTCPTGALEDRTVVTMGRPTRWTRTTCPYCGVGCELLVGTRDEHIVTAVPAHDAPVNRGHACVKGRYAHGFVHATDRAQAPMIRESGAWRTVSWDDAVAAVAGALSNALDRSGPSGVGVFGSARATNEDNYLLQKFARLVLRTNNVDCCARVCHAPSATGLRQVFGTGAATNSFADIEHAATLLVCGANVTENHPVVGARIKAAARSGTALIVIDPRRTELAAHADVHLRPVPGTNVALLNAMAATILQEGLVHDAFTRERVANLDQFAAFVGRYLPEAVAETCGCNPADVRAAARLYATRPPAMSFHGLGLTEHTQGTDGVRALANLTLLTGNVGRPGSGMNPLRGQNNVQGSAHMGCEPDFVTGFAPAHDAPWFAEVWGAPIPAAPGLNAIQMIDAARAGSLHALWVVGWDILQTQPNMAATERALASLDVLVVQDLFLNETARQFATIFLPACSTFEKDGTFINGERRVQRVRRVIDPLGETRPDWEIVCAVARAMGHPDRFAFDEPSQIWDEVRRVWPAGAGMSYARLDQPGGLQWPCPSEDHPGTALLHEHEFTKIGAMTSLQCVDYEASPEQPDPGYPFLLVTGRALHQFNAGTMSRRSVPHVLHPTDLLEISRADARRIGIADGDTVEVASRHGATRLPVRISDMVADGQLFATFSDPASRLNLVTGPYRDTVTDTPEYKRTMVRITIAVS
jgi:formate dehydrogenase major subunit